MTKCPRWVCLAVLTGLLVPGCGKKEPISIGAVGDLRSAGRVAESGYRNGILLAEDAVNERGGVGGRLVRTIFVDDQGDPTSVPKIDEKLISSGVVAILGHNTSATTAAALPIADRNKVLLFSPEATSSAFAGRNDYFARDEVSESLMAVALATYAVDKMKLGSVGVVLDEKNSPFSRPFFEAFRKKMVALGKDAELIYPYYVPENSEAGRQIDAFLKRGGDSILLITNAVDTRNLGQTARRVRNDVPLLGTTWAVPPTGSETAGALPEDLVFPCTFDPDSRAPSYLDFKQRYEKRFGVPVDYHAVHSYEAMMILVDAMGKEGPDSRRLLAAIARRGEFPGLQGPIRIDSYGDCQRPVFMLEEVGGVLHRVDRP